MTMRRRVALVGLGAALIAWAPSSLAGQLPGRPLPTRADTTTRRDTTAAKDSTQPRTMNVAVDAWS